MFYKLDYLIFLPGKKRYVIHKDGYKKNAGTWVGYCFLSFFYYVC